MSDADCLQRAAGLAASEPVCSLAPRLESTREGITRTVDGDLAKRTPCLALHHVVDHYAIDKVTQTDTEPMLRSVRGRALLRWAEGSFGSLPRRYRVDWGRSWPSRRSRSSGCGARGRAGLPTNSVRSDGRPVGHQVASPRSVDPQI